MIEDLDETLRRLLVREMPIKSGEVDVDFKQPKREWSARLSRPTLNLFLYEVRENTKLRQMSQGWDVEERSNNRVSERRKAVRVDLPYIITAWANEPEDEHRLLSRTLMALFRTPTLPDDLLPESLQDQPAPVSLKVAQAEDTDKVNMSELWSALDNVMRPAVTCVVTMALNPYQAMQVPLVRERVLRVGPSDKPAVYQQFVEQSGADVYWTVGGTVRSKKPLDTVRLMLVERGTDVEILPEGRFTIGNLVAGDYTLEIKAEGQKPLRRALTVPAPDYNFEV